MYLFLTFQMILNKKKKKNLQKLTETYNKSN